MKKEKFLLTLKELSEALGIEDWRISRWRRKGIIPSVKMGETHYYNLESVVKTIRGREKLGSLDFRHTGYAKAE